MINNEEKYTQGRKTYSVLCSLPMVFAIIHAIGQIILQSLLKYDALTSTYSTVPALGMMFSSSLLGGLISSYKSNADLVNSISSVITILLTILTILFATYSIKGKKAFNIATLSLYGFDSICAVALIIFNYIGNAPIKLSVVDIVLTAILHLIFLASIVALFIIGRQLDKYENEN